MRALGRAFLFRSGLWRGAITYAVVLVLIVAAVASVAAVRQARAVAAGCGEVKSSLAARGALPVVSTGAERVLVVGDSWSAGQGLAASPKAAIDHSWAAEIGRARGWTVLDDAIPYTGFVNGGFCGKQQFAARAAADLAAHPSMVLIEGGINDTDASNSEVTAAAASLLARFASVKTVVVIGPGDAPARPAADRSRVARLLEAAAGHAGRPFVDASRWKLSYQPDQLHPTQAGQDTFAARVASELG